MPGPPRVQPLSALNLKSLSQSLARVDHFFQARIRNRFGSTTRALARFIPPGSLILDIGANHGKFTRNFAALHDGSCTVWAFEPLEYNYTLLESVVGRKKNVRIFRIALSDSVGTAEFYVPFKDSDRINPGSAHLGRAGDPASYGVGSASNVATLTVPTDTLDRLVERERPARLDFIKIDVEGAEVLVFRGGRATLDRFRPAIYTELQLHYPERIGSSVAETIATLRTLGYAMHRFPEGATHPEPCDAYSPDCRDYLFLHNSRPQP